MEKPNEDLEKCAIAIGEAVNDQHVKRPPNAQVIVIVAKEQDEQYHFGFVSSVQKAEMIAMLTQFISNLDVVNEIKPTIH